VPTLVDLMLPGCATCVEVEYDLLISHSTAVTRAYVKLNRSDVNACVNCFSSSSDAVCPTIEAYYHRGREWKVRLSIKFSTFSKNKSEMCLRAANWCPNDNKNPKTISLQIVHGIVRQFVCGIGLSHGFLSH
jgi:hypothetical protein